jgi:hypothetical protein
MPLQLIQFTSVSHAANGKTSVGPFYTKTLLLFLINNPFSIFLPSSSSHLHNKMSLACMPRGHNSLLHAPYQPKAGHFSFSTPQKALPTQLMPTSDNASANMGSKNRGTPFDGQSSVASTVHTKHPPDVSDETFTEQQPEHQILGQMALRPPDVRNWRTLSV